MARAAKECEWNAKYMAIVEKPLARWAASATGEPAALRSVAESYARLDECLRM